MEKATIKNVGLAWQQVQENQQMANKKAMAKAAASSEKGKAAVTLPKAPWDKDKEKTEMSSKEKMKKGLYNSKMDPVDKKELKGTHADRKDGDIDNDGDEDKSDKYLHKRRKAITKNMKQEGEVEMNPTKKKDKASTQNADTMESTLPPVYARIMEARKHDDKALKGSPPGEGMSPMAKKTKDDMEVSLKPDDTEEKGHDDASKAGRAGPKAKARSGDNMKGDKSVINPVKK
jgi:hypothetical protein